eukprot:10938714-Alexandrium_andersonii.AAC.1
MTRAIVEERSVDGLSEMKAAVIAACQAKSQLVRRDGFSPAQRVLGTELRLPGDVLDEPGAASSHSW